MLGVAAAALLALLAPAAAHAQGESFQAFSDTASVPTPEEALTELQALRPAVCPRGRARKAPRLTRAQAIRRAEAFLRRRARSAYARFLRSPQARRAAVAEDTAAAAVTGNAPAAALAGFIAAHRKEPRNPRHLLNASVVLVKFGLPGEALALVTAAERMKQPRTPPMGISLRALAANNRGFALIGLRRYADAERHLRTAVSREPLLSEAKLNLAAARLCSGRIAQAVEPYIAGKRRNAFADSVSAARVRAPGSASLDLSRSVDGTLPVLDIPQTANDALASYPAMKAAHERRRAEADQRYQEALDTLAAYSQSLTGVPLMQAQRSGQILELWNLRESERPQLKTMLEAVKATKPKLNQSYFDWTAEYERIRRDCQDQGGTSDELAACFKAGCIPATQSANARWAGLMREADTATREWTRELYRYASGLTANLANPAARAAILAAARHEIYTIYVSYVMLEADAWTSTLDTFKEDCVESAGEPKGEQGEPDLGPGFACPPELKAIKFGFKLPPFFSVGVSCEVVSVEASYGKPIAAFAQVKYTLASGSTTVFAGAKAGGSIPGINASGRAGIQMTFDSLGNITDTGLRATGSVSGPSLPGVGGPELSGQLDYSLAGTLL